MDDPTCVAFLQWALPRLGMRWAGFRRARRQVGKRIDRRLRWLGLADADAYRVYLEAHAGEWPVLDGLCRIPISRFFRDRAVFAGLGEAVLPRLADAAVGRGATALRCWSAGCASGEEPYSLALVCAFDAAARAPGIGFEVVASDADARMIERARRAHYKASSLRELALSWRHRAFVMQDGRFALRPELRRFVSFVQQDIRAVAPASPFDLVLCRNMAFTYFAEPVQRRIVRRIGDSLVCGGVLVVGAHERLPADVTTFVLWPDVPGTYRKTVP